MNAANRPKFQLAEGLTKKLAKLGLYSWDDLRLHFPLRYEDETRLSTVANARWGEGVQIEGVVVSCELAYRPRRQLQVCLQDDEGGELWLRFFSFYASQQQALAVGHRIRVFGEARGGFFGLEMVHPRFRQVAPGEALPEALTPIYPSTAGLTQGAMRKLVSGSLKGGAGQDLLRPYLPVAAWPGWDETLATLHNPPAQVPASALDDRSHPAWQRVKFEELLTQQLSLRKAYAARRELGAPILAGQGTLAARLLAALPFGLTAAQQRAMGEIDADLALPHPMQRLLQGDVGSGKTIVGALAACTAIEAGCQVAFMAPTEILAEQHYYKLAAWLEPLGAKVVWLSGSLKGKQKKAHQALVAAGAQLVVGTHALIQTDVDFSRLGLVIVDEQHRFGVAQRLALRAKGSNPHQLMMSATPIPRTLAMSYYADLDVSVLDELPPGRTPIRTKLVAADRRSEVISFVSHQVAKGRQVYWVCPLIEESETLQLQTALETYQQLTEELPALRVGLIHGRLKPEEKQGVMQAFVAGEVDLLVATTVIEVGVDVPNASLMVIEHAERFGLSQLHQLRGRVGRGSHESVCVLLYAKPLSVTARQRLKVIYENTDGFEVARQDLAIRGPGEFVGSRQSGVPLLRYADLELDGHLLDQARQVADRLLREAPEIAEGLLQRWLGGREELLKA